MKKTLDRKAVEEEILICQSIIENYEKELCEARRDMKRISSRFEVLKALDEVLPNGNSKNLNLQDLNDLANKRTKLTPKLSSLQRKIEHFQTLLRGLQQLKK